MKTISLLSVLFSLVIANNAFAIMNTTWGKVEVFKIPKILYKGKQYSGALVASQLTRREATGYSPSMVIMKNPGVLVKNLMAPGIDQVVPLEAFKSGNLSDARAPFACNNIDKKFQQYNADWGRPHSHLSGKSAYFIDKNTVQISENPVHDLTTSIGCSDTELTND